MSTTAQQVIEAAYARSTANDAGKLATDTELIAHLDRTFQRYFAMAAVASGDTFLSATPVVLTGSPASASLPTDVIDLPRVELASTGAKVNLIPAVEKDRAWHLSPAVYRRGQTLVSRGQAGDPGSGVTLTAYVLDAPASLTALTSTLDARWPHRFDSLLILDLACYLSDKDVDRDPKDYADLTAALKDELTAFDLLLQNMNSAKETPHVGRSVAAGKESNG